MKLLYSVFLILLVASLGDCDHEHHKHNRKRVISHLPPIQVDQENTGNTVTLDEEAVEYFFKAIKEFIVIVHDIISSYDINEPDNLSSISDDNAIPNTQLTQTAPVMHLRSLEKQLQDIQEEISNTNGNNIQDVKEKIEIALGSCNECMSQMGKSTRRATPKRARAFNVFRRSYKLFAEAAQKCWRPTEKPTEKTTAKPKSAKNALYFKSRKVPN